LRLKSDLFQKAVLLTLNNQNDHLLLCTLGVRAKEEASPSRPWVMLVKLRVANSSNRTNSLLAKRNNHLVALQGSNPPTAHSWAPAQIKLQFTWSDDDWSCPPITVRMHQRFSFMNQLIQRSILATKIFLSNGQHFWMFFGWKFSCHIVWKVPDFAWALLPMLKLVLRHILKLV